ncbi:MAG TPA: ABC transporter permease [Acidimicrobiia bacterium]|jgi:branched-chain amino acid transport system permease protein|nr:ABC transporter permease [Acidimicrobiia bacterium]
MRDTTDASLPVRKRLADYEWLGRLLAYVLPVAALIFAVRVWPFPAPNGVILDGALGGGRIALIALGIALIYRANRVINFAQGDLGQVPATLGALLVITLSVNYFVAFTTGLVAAVVLGVAVETLIIRRFFRAPRLILTVATIGLSQVLIAAGLFIAQAFGQDFQTNRLDAPFTVKFQVGSTIFNGNDVIAMITIPIAFIALAAWLRLSNIGVAVRGSAERADRASTLGIPVRRLHTIVWTVATVLAFLGMWLRAGAVGLPIGTVLGPTFLLLALGAVVIGRMDRFGVIAAAAIALGILDKAITFQPNNNPAFNDAVLFLVILGALLVTRRPSRGRVGADQVSTWQAAREVRPIPRELKGLPEVRFARWALLGAVAAFLVTLPLWLDESRINLAAIIVIFGIIGVSLVVLTGWAGQVSLGQMGFAGVGAAVGGWVTYYTETDLSIALLAGGAAGALAAIVVGYPALRRRGLTLAVSTLAFALFVSSFLLNQELFGENGEPPGFLPGQWLPGFRIDRTPLFGRFDIESETRFYFLCLVVLGLMLVVVRGVRRSRTGRVLIAIRENDSAARSYGINTTRTNLACFALSGFIAAVAGVLLVHQQTGLQVGAGNLYLPEESLRVFSMVVIGGLGSLPGVLLGAAYIWGTEYFLPGQWSFLATGAGLLLILMVLPGGLGAVLYDTRDWLLRQIAKRRGLVVPSLVADVRVEEPVPEPLLEEAEKAAERAPVEVP